MENVFIILGFLVLVAILSVLVLVGVFIWRNIKSRQNVSLEPTEKLLEATKQDAPNETKEPVLPKTLRAHSTFKATTFPWWSGRLGIVAILAFLCLLPLYFINKLVNGREYYQLSVNNTLAEQWGPSQTLTGPILTFPYSIKSTVSETIPLGTDNETKKLRFETAYREIEVQKMAALTPKSLKISGLITPETRKRGIYESLVYSTNIQLQGNFELPSEKELTNKLSLKSPPLFVDWEKAKLVVGLSGPAAMRTVSEVSFGDRKFSFVPGQDDYADLPKGFSTALELSRNQINKYDFSFSLSFAGSEALMIAPVADQNSILLTSDWPHPNFTGSSLPITRKISDTGFEAIWELPSLTRAYQSLRTLSPTPTIKRDKYEDTPVSEYEEFTVGVKLENPIDKFKMIHRAVKYAVLFIALTFLVFFLWETSHGQAKIHLIQYGVVGLALVLFYLILLTLSEHLSFLGAYILAASLIIILISGYGLAISGKLRSVLGALALLALLYTVLYVILSLEDYALVAGTALLTVAITALMVATRKLSHLNQV
ncbi:MAG: cell envelope integrity protein CreD [Deltaproteobacteria bacterium]|jgi:inner membrane protein|nr:cell envelope integrity protein CreD [Deltaproteobacteria bacterium]